jgi:hypothetical protein
MRRLLVRMLPAFHLTRVTTAFAAVANVWFVVLWTRAHPRTEPGTEAIAHLPLWLVLLAAGINALGLFVLAATLNDLLDWRRDAALHPDRPIPSGRVSVDGAISLVVVSFGAAVLGSTVLGIPSVVLTLAVGMAVLLFNAAGKFVPAVGLVALGLIYAGQMVVPNLHLRFAWPVWLVMTHALVVGAAVHVLGRKTPGVSARAAAAAVAGWAFWSGVMLAAVWWRLRIDGDRGAAGGVWPSWVSPGTAVAPGVLALAFLLLVWRRVHLLGRGPRVAEKIARYGALWLPMYGAAWLLGEGATAGALLLAGVAVVGLLGMTVLREVVALIEQPLGYRR